MNKNTTVYFTGYRTLPYGAALDQLKINLRTAILDAIGDGYQTFLLGGCCGFELLAASEILAYKNRLPPPTGKIYLLPPLIKLYATLPYEEHHIHWTEPQRNLYFDTMAQCDRVITLQTKYEKDCYKRLNQYMIAHSSRVIAFWNDTPHSNTAKALRNAEKNGITVIRVTP